MSDLLPAPGKMPYFVKPGERQRVRAFLAKQAEHDERRNDELINLSEGKTSKKSNLYVAFTVVPPLALKPHHICLITQESRRQKLLPVDI